MGRGKRDKIFLSAEERKRLEAISHNGYASTKKILHAQILLMSDEGEGAKRKRTDEEIADARVKLKHLYPVFQLDEDLNT